MLCYKPNWSNAGVRSVFLGMEILIENDGKFHIKTPKGYFEVKFVLIARQCQ